MPRLVVLRLSDSFSTLWPMLAKECGLELTLTPSLEPLAALVDGVGIIAAGGAEARLTLVLRELGRGPAPVAVVGARAERRTIVAAMRAGVSDFFVLGEDLPLLRSWLRTQAERQRLRARQEHDVPVSQRREAMADDLDVGARERTADGNRIPFPAPLNTVIVAAVREMLALCGGNKSEAARRLAISRTRLQRVLSHGDLGEDTDEPPAANLAIAQPLIEA